MKTILFFGDSITDCGRHRDEPLHMGEGHAAMIAARLGLEEPGEYTFYNRGIAGNNVVDLFSRVRRDVLDLNPDVLTVLIGVNDSWCEEAGKSYIGTEKYKAVYTMMLDEIKAALPQVQIILIEPFLTKGEPERKGFEHFVASVREKAAFVKELAKERGYGFVAMQEALERMVQTAPYGYWTHDGIHPNLPLRQYLADRWIETFHAMQNAEK